MTQDEGGSTATKQPKDVLLQCRQMLDNGDARPALIQLDALVIVLSNNPSMRTLLANAQLLKAEAHLNLTELSKVSETCNDAISTSREIPDPSIEASARRLMGNMCWKRGELQTSLEHLIKALEIAIEVKDHPLEGKIRIDKATALGYMGDIGASEREFREAILLLERIGDLRELARAYNNLANCIMNAKAYDRAAQMFAKSKKICEKLGDMPNAAFAGVNRAECLIELGQTKEALAELDWAQPLVEKKGELYSLLAIVHTYGLAHAKAKDWAKAEEYMIKARRLSQKASVPMAEAKVIADIGRMYKWRGDKDKARIYMKEAMEIFSRMGAKREAQMLLEEMKG